MGKTALWQRGGRALRRTWPASCAAGRSRPRPSLRTPRSATCWRSLRGCRELPEPQRHALEVALLRAEPGAPESPQRAVGSGLLACCERGADDRRRSTTSMARPSDRESCSRSWRGAWRRAVGLLVARRRGRPACRWPRCARRVSVGPARPRLNLARLLAARAGAGLRPATARPPAPRLRRQPVLRARVIGPRRSAGAARARLEPPAGAPSPRAAEAARDRLARLSRPTRALVDAGRPRPGRADGVGAATAARRRGAARRRRPRRSRRGVARSGRARRARALHPPAARHGRLRAGRRRAARLHARLAGAGRRSRGAGAAPRARGGRARRGGRAPRSTTRRGGPRARGAPDAAAELLEQARRLTPAAVAGGRAASRRPSGTSRRATPSGRGRCSRRCSPMPPGGDRAYALARLGWVRAHREGFRAAADVFAAALAEPTSTSRCGSRSSRACRGALHSIDERRAGAGARAQPRSRWPRSSASRRCSRTRSRTSRSWTRSSGEGMAMALIERALALDTRARMDADPRPARPDPRAAALLGRAARAGARPARRAARRRRSSAATSTRCRSCSSSSRGSSCCSATGPPRGATPRECVESVDAERRRSGERPYALAIEALVAAHLGEVDAARALIDDRARAGRAARRPARPRSSCSRRAASSSSRWATPPPTRRSTALRERRRGERAARAGAVPLRRPTRSRPVAARPRDDAPAGPARALAPGSCGPWPRAWRRAVADCWPATGRLRSGHRRAGGGARDRCAGWPAVRARAHAARARRAFERRTASSAPARKRSRPRSRSSTRSARRCGRAGAGRAGACRRARCRAMAR